MTNDTNATILIIDDASESLRLLSQLLQPTYRILAATSRTPDLRIADSHPKPELILLVEKWDGSGYPDGLAGDEIPLSARLRAIADVFDALISPRSYKPVIPFNEARDIIATERGKHFNPDLVDVFLVGFDDFVTIVQKYLDAVLITNGEKTNSLYPNRIPL